MTVSTLKSSGGDYSSMVAWEAAQAATLTAPAELECYDFALAEDVAFAGITTSASNYVRVYAASGNGHDGRSRAVSGTGFRISGTNAAGTIRNAINHLRLEHLEIEATGSGHALVSTISLASGANDIRVESCIIHDVVTGSSYTAQLSASNMILTLRNNIVYGYQRTWDTRGAASVLSENNTLWRHAAQLGVVSTGELTCKNTYSGAASAGAECFWTGGSAPSGNNNISSDTSQATDYTAGVSSVAGSAVFTSVTPGAEDFTLLAGTNALVGAGATLTVGTDAVGYTRTVPWDVGALARQSGAATQTLTPSLFSNTNTFYASTVTRGAVGLTPSLFSNTNSFYAPTVSASYSLTPSLFVNSNSFYGPTISTGVVNLTPGLFSSSNTFYGHVVSVGGVTLTPGLYANSNAFYGQSVSESYTLSASLFTNSASFYSHTVTTGAVTLTPSLFSNSHTFYSATVSQNGAPQDLTPSLFSNTNTFYAATVAPGSVSITPSLFSSSNTFYSPTVNLSSGPQTLTASRLDNTNAFYAATVSHGAVNIAPGLFANTNTFYGELVSSAYALHATLFANDSTFYSASISQGIRPSLFANSAVFYGAVVAPGAVYILPSLFSESNFFYSETVSSGVDVQYPLAGLTQAYALIGQAETYPLAGQSQTYPL